MVYLASQEIRKNQILLMTKDREEDKIACFKHIRLIIKDKSNSYQPPSMGARSEDVSTLGAVGGITGAVIRTNEANGSEKSVRGDDRPSTGADRHRGAGPGTSSVYDRRPAHNRLASLSAGESSDVSCAGRALDVCGS